MHEAVDERLFMYATGWQTGSRRLTRWGPSLETSISLGRTTLLKMKTFESIATCCGGLSRLAACCKKIRRDFGGFGGVFARPKSAVHIRRQSTQNKLISWITPQGRSCQRSAAALGFSFRASFDAIRAAVDFEGQCLLRRTKAAGFKDLRLWVRNALRFFADCAWAR